MIENENELLEEMMIVELINLVPLVEHTLSVFVSYQGRLKGEGIGMVLDRVQEIGRVVQTLAEIEEPKYYDDKAISLLKRLLKIIDPALDYATPYLRERLKLLRDLILRYLNKVEPSYTYKPDFTESELSHKRDQDTDILSRAFERIKEDEEREKEEFRRRQLETYAFTSHLFDLDEFPKEPEIDPDQIILEALNRLHGLRENYIPDKIRWERQKRSEELRSKEEDPLDLVAKLVLERERDRWDY